MLKNIRNKLMTVAGGDGVESSSAAAAVSSDDFEDDNPVSGFICPQCRRDFPDPDALQIHFVAHLEDADQTQAEATASATASATPSDSKRGSIFKSLSAGPKTSPASKSAPAPMSTFYPGEEAEDFVCPMCAMRFPVSDQLRDHFDVAHVALDFEQETKEMRSDSLSIVEGFKQQDEIVKNLIQENKELKVSLDEEKWYVEELKKELEKYEASAVAATSLPEEDQKQQQEQQVDQDRDGEAALVEKNKFLENQLEENLAQMQQLRGSKELMERKAAELAAVVAECRAKVDETESVKAGMQEEMRELLSKLETAEEALSQRGSDEDDASTLKQELVSIQSICDAQVQTLTDQVATLERELNRKEEELTTSKGEWGARVSEGKSALAEMETRLKDQRREILENAEADAKEKNDAEEMAALKLLKEQIELVQREADEAKETTNKLRTENDRLSDVVKNAESETSRANEEAEGERRKGADLRAKLEDVTKANEEMGEKYLKALEENSEKESEVMRQCHRLEEAKSKAEEEKTRLENKVEDKRRNEQLINKKLAEMEVAKQEQVEKISQLEEKVKDHESQVAEWSSREVAMETALLQKEGVQRDLQKQVEVLTIRHTEAQSQVTALEVQHQEMQSRIVDFEKGMESLEAELASTKTAFEETKVKQVETQQQFQQILDEKRKIESSAAEVEAAHDSELTALREAKHTLIGEKVEIARKIESLETDLNTKREDLKAMLAETSQERTRFDSEIKRMKDDVIKNEEKWSKEEDALMVDLSVKDTKLSLLGENVATLEQELQRMDRAKDEAWSEKLEIEAKVSILEDEKRLLVERCISGETKIDEQKNRIKGLVAQVESLQCAAEELARENQFLQVRENQMLQVKQSQIQSRKWTDDSDTTNCSSCTKTFSITVRKHHCRHCGSVFCAECTDNTANVPSFKKPQRVCETCFNELKNA